METEIQQINKKLSLILLLLQGNELNKADTGMIGKQKEMEENIKKLENKFNRTAWSVAGAVGFTAFNLLQFIKKLL